MQNLTLILVTSVMPTFETQEWEVLEYHQSRLQLAPQWVFEVANWSAILTEKNRFWIVAEMFLLDVEAYI